MQAAFAKLQKDLLRLAKVVARYSPTFLHRSHVSAVMGRDRYVAACQMHVLALAAEEQAQTRRQLDWSRKPGRVSCEYDSIAMERNKSAKTSHIPSFATPVLPLTWAGQHNTHVVVQKDRPTKAVVLKDKSVVMLYNIDGDVYCSDANSTAYQYPLIHAKIVKGACIPSGYYMLHVMVSVITRGKLHSRTSLFGLTTGEKGPGVEVPLDGTVYDLETGKVLHAHSAVDSLVFPARNGLAMLLGLMRDWPLQ